ncbi:hypothetical protein F8271_17135 [Micromonospora sp. ALFpr18c]|uniref:hypothetical protein n=1 Tax=unclassified Micromonospora TaxID=2617518 RepID=UPI00124B96B3|nr:MULTISPECIES: hypothetical protein [unclassified Micromonospora]KAB1939526.1 hypothetical protein F8271_17135 [Micromonospora sp. ALFpr18c]MDG4757284.1 hypothetical protein [Micromonospora sp. WMMD710]
MSRYLTYLDALLRLLPQAAVPQPDRGGAAPPVLVGLVTLGLNIIAWAGTAAGVAGVLITGTMMAISHKRGETSEHMSRLGLVLGGCILVASAGPLVSFVFDFNAG